MLQRHSLHPVRYFVRRLQSLPFIPPNFLEVVFTLLLEPFVNTMPMGSRIRRGLRRIADYLHLWWIIRMPSV